MTKTPNMYIHIHKSGEKVIKDVMLHLETKPSHIFCSHSFARCVLLAIYYNNFNDKKKLEKNIK